MKEILTRVTIFIICARVLVQFRAGKEYEKYLRFLVGLMLLVQIVTPLLEQMNSLSGADIWGRMEQLLEEETNQYGYVEEVAEEGKSDIDCIHGYPAVCYQSSGEGYKGAHWDVPDADRADTE